jgi:hypothetical protein
VIACPEELVGECLATEFCDFVEVILCSAYFFGESWHVVEKWFGRASATLVGLLLCF